MRPNDTRAVVETGFLTAAIIVLTVVGTNIPFMGFLSAVVAPTAVAVIGVRRGIRWSIMAVVASTLVLSFVLSLPVALVTGITFSLPGAIIGYGFSKHWGLGRLVCVPALLATVGTVFQVVVNMYMLQVDYMTIWQTMKTDTVKTITDMYMAQGLESWQIDEAVATMQQQLELIGRILLTACFAAMAVLMYVTCLLTSMVLRRTGSMNRRLPGLSQWRMPVTVLYVYILGLLLMYWGNTRTIEWLSVVSVNMWWIGGILLSLQGLSCCWSLCKSYGIGPVGKTFFMAILVVMQMSAVVLGALDILLDCRNRFAKRSE